MSHFSEHPLSECYASNETVHIPGTKQTITRPSYPYFMRYTKVYIDGLVQERRNPIGNTLELRPSCTNPSIWGFLWRKCPRGHPFTGFDLWCAQEARRIGTVPSRHNTDILSRILTQDIPQLARTILMFHFWSCCAVVHDISHTWWRHQMETLSALLAICAGNSPHKGQRRGALMLS